MVIAPFPSDWQLLSLVFPLNLFVAASQKATTGGREESRPPEAAMVGAVEAEARSGRLEIAEPERAVELGKGASHALVGGQDLEVFADGQGDVEGVVEGAHVVERERHSVIGQLDRGREGDPEPAELFAR